MLLSFSEARHLCSLRGPFRPIGVTNDTDATGSARPLKTRFPPVATVCRTFDERWLRADTAPTGKARFPAHLPRSGSRSATDAIRRLRPLGFPGQNTRSGRTRCIPATPALRAICNIGDRGLTQALEALTTPPTRWIRSAGPVRYERTRAAVKETLAARFPLPIPMIPSRRFARSGGRQAPRSGNSPNSFVSSVKSQSRRGTATIAPPAIRMKRDSTDTSDGRDGNAPTTQSEALFARRRTFPACWATA